MILSPKYFQRVLSLRYGKLILCAEILLILIAMFVFFKTIPWLTAHNISDISTYESPTPPPPEWAESFAVNHGDFVYYADSRSSNPVRMWLYLGLNFVFIVPSLIFTAWLLMICKSKKFAEQGAASDR